MSLKTEAAVLPLVHKAHAKYCGGTKIPKTQINIHMYLTVDFDRFEIFWIPSVAGANTSMRGRG